MRTYLTLFLFALMSIQPGAEESKNSSSRFSEDLAELPPVAGLADPLISDEGSKITSREDWRARRKKLIDSLLFYQYGRIPPKPDRINATVDRVREHASGLGTEE